MQVDEIHDGWFGSLTSELHSGVPCFWDRWERGFELHTFPYQGCFGTSP